MRTDDRHNGRCFCGAVRFSVTGAPAAAGYCHCDSCRRWSAAPVNAFTLWPPGAVSIVQGADRIGSYSATPASLRKWCTACGGHLFTEHPGLGLIDVYAATLADFEFRPGAHVHYREAVLELRDGIARFNDLPREMGGSGERLDDPAQRGAAA